MNAVVTLCIGDKFKELAALTHPRMKAYATSIGAEFVVIEERQFNTNIICYEKLQIGNLLTQYDRVIYLDTDILIRESLPNLFDLVDEESFGAFPEGRYLGRGADLSRAEKDGWGAHIDKAPNYFNAGVFVASKCHRSVFQAPPVFIDNFQDQTWLNCQVWKSGTPIEYLPFLFNHMPSMDWARRAFSHIVHYAGGATSYIPYDLERGL